MDPEKQFLPQELLDNFVDEIGREYVASFANGYSNDICQMTLISLLSVSRSFHDRAIGALFRQVDLTDRPERDINHIIKRMSGLRQIMRPTPGSTLRNVAPCIQTFTLNLKAMRFGNVQRFWDPIVGDAGHTWLVDTLSNKETTGLFDDLHQNDFGIREFTIRLTTIRNVIWTELPPHFSSSMLSLIRSSHLRTLYLAKISHIPPTLLNGSRIRDLRLEQLEMSNNHHPTEHPSNDADGHNLHCPKLDVFQTNDDFPVDLDPRTSPLTDLKKFKANCLVLRHYTFTQKILLLAQNTLEDIRLDFSGHIQMSARSIDFECMPRLRTLTLFYFRSFAAPYWPLNDPGIAHICQLLNPQSPFKSLSEITLGLHFKEVGMQVSSLSPQPNSHWHAIDGILTGAKHPALRKVGVQVNSDITIWDHAAVFNEKQYVQDARRLLFEAFARLSASEKIDLTVNVDTSVLHRRNLRLLVDDTSDHDEFA